MPVVTRGIVKFKKSEINTDVLTELALTKTIYADVASQMQAIELSTEYMKENVLFDALYDILDSFNVPYVFTGVTSKGSVNTVKKVLDPKNVFSFVDLDLRETNDNNDSPGGHFTAGFVKGNDVHLYDSMCSPCGNHIDYKYFESIFKRLYPRKNIVQVNTDAFYQPSGGFCVNKKQMKELLKKNFRDKLGNLDDIFIAHQFDAMSQHHFCYVEAIVYLSHMIYSTPMGPKNDLEKRLIFIKKVAYGLGFVFSDVSKVHNNYTYIMSVEDSYMEKAITFPRGQLNIKAKQFRLPQFNKNMNVGDIIQACL